MRGLLGICILVWMGCGPSPYFEESIEINPLGWSSDNDIRFNPEITDTSAIYELQLIIDHQTTYRYENIYFSISTHFPDGTKSEEKLSVDLATNKGKWVGNCSGESCKLKVYLLDNFKFPEPGKYGIELSQYTRDEPLEGINELAMVLYDTPTSR